MTEYKPVETKPVETKLLEPKVDPKLPKEAKTVKQVDLQGIALPPEEWVALPEEITPEMKDQLITILISYAGKLDAPPRFTTASGAYRYFNLLSDVQIDRINKRVEEIKTKLAEYKAAPKAEAKPVL